MPLTITSTGNAGVRLENNAGALYIDSFFHHASHVGNAPALQGAAAAKADVILITHNHYDHLNPEDTRDAALASGAVVAGPAKAIAFMTKLLPPERLVTLEPKGGLTRPPAQCSAAFGSISVTTFRTYHGAGHNSYLIDMGGMRIFHDADNEETQPLDTAKLGKVDALFLCPWAGSGAGDFVARLQPGKWFLIHMTDEEIDQHRAGHFLPPLINPVPPGVIALRGGETMEL